MSTKPLLAVPSAKSIQRETKAYLAQNAWADARKLRIEVSPADSPDGLKFVVQGELYPRRHTGRHPEIVAINNFTHLADAESLVDLLRYVAHSCEPSVPVAMEVRAAKEVIL